ncbi:PTS glucose transporter subunit IIA [Actinomyces oris]|uniref:PTS glucose transporter subunit IIA n=1 Tax=Actinomyces oris TaxID=544580 RepID=A0A1Q8VLX3_9ACTO|nr:PTS glucose transporter subunit IIA [Actinomyces oris]OLO49101.1 PTS glucose transporter subunit IIA [Actinomyces oris]
MSLTVQSPVSGVVVALSDVPDPVFSGRIVGPGVAVIPDPAGGDEVSALAPISGTIAKIHPHAYIITNDAGHSVLVHLGLDTVSLGGSGFTLLADEGQRVDAGSPVISWSPAQIEAGGLNPIVPIIALEGDESDLEPVPPGHRAAAGDTLMTWA